MTSIQVYPNFLVWKDSLVDTGLNRIYEESVWNPEFISKVTTKS